MDSRASSLGFDHSKCNTWTLRILALVILDCGLYCVYFLGTWEDDIYYEYSDALH